MKNKYIKILTITLIALMLMLTACNNASKVDDHITMVGEVPIYYLSNDGYSLVNSYVISDESTVEERIRHIIESFQNPPEGYNSVYTKDIPVISYTFDDRIVSLHCSADYTAVPVTKEILWRTAIVKSLVGIDGVDGVEILVADQQLMDATGNPMGILTEDSFEGTVNHKLGELKTKLYFADSTGQMLIPEERTILYPLDERVEYYIVNALINGPEEYGRYPILNKSVVLSDVMIKDGVCYLYLEADFLNDSLENSPSIPIYAIVNTLSELSEVGRVQFVVDGVENPKFRGEFTLAKPLSANLDLIYKEH